MIVLDTNVISEMLRPNPAPRVEAWLAMQNPGDVYLTAITEAELRYGLAVLPDGQRRDRLMLAVDAILRELFAGRILAFDSAATRAYAKIASVRRGMGRPISQFDCQIASLCQVHGSRLATRNVKDFEACGIELIDPWAG